MKNTKRMISTIYESLHAKDLDELEDVYKNWASDYDNDVLNLAGYVGHLITSDPVSYTHLTLPTILLV